MVGGDEHLAARIGVALGVRRSGRDAKWQQFAGLLGEILLSAAKAPSTDSSRTQQACATSGSHPGTAWISSKKQYTVEWYASAVSDDSRRPYSRSSMKLR